MALILWTHLSLNIFVTVSLIDTGFSALGLVRKNWQIDATGIYSVPWALGSPSAIYKISHFLDSKTNCEIHVHIGCIVSEKSAKKSVHRTSAYTVALFWPICILHVLENKIKCSTPSNIVNRGSNGSTVTASTDGQTEGQTDRRMPPSTISICFSVDNKRSLILHLVGKTSKTQSNLNGAVSTLIHHS